MARATRSLTLAAKRGAVAGLALGFVALLGGCGQTERTIRVTSDPPDAIVYANGREVGRTPVAFDFLWYGDYRFEVRKDGYETLKTNRKVRAPVNQWVFFDIVTEVFIPTTIRDEKHFHFVLTPLPESTEEDLLTRAKQLRDQTVNTDK